jgi:GNAT superfamily N-acetyltransferase
MTGATTESYEIRDYRPEDEAGVMALLMQSLGEGGSFTRSAEFWRWKHLQNAFGVSQLLVAANSEILGLRAFQRWGFRTPAGTLRAVRAVDTATHPDYRRLGVFSRLTQAALARARAEGVNLVFNTPNAQSMSGYLKMGWQFVGKPRLLAKVLNPLGLAVGLPHWLSAARRRRAPADPTRLFHASGRPATALLEHGEAMERVLALDDRFNADGIRTDRSLAFLQWRYASSPSPQYFAHWMGEEPLAGAAIFRPNIRRGLREIMLSELFLGYGAAPEARALIRELSRQVRADYIVAAATPGTQHWGILRRAGFVPLPKRLSLNFTTLPLDLPEGSRDPTRLEHWRLSLGDLELF